MFSFDFGLLYECVSREIIILEKIGIFVETQLLWLLGLPWQTQNISELCILIRRVRRPCFFFGCAGSACMLYNQRDPAASHMTFRRSDGRGKLLHTLRFA